VQPQQTENHKNGFGAGAGLQAGEQMLGIMCSSVPLLRWVSRSFSHLCYRTTHIDLCYNWVRGNAMTIQQLEPQLSNLSRAEKAELVQRLLQDILNT
jgi:hypothetical protein